MNCLRLYYFLLNSLWVLICWLPAVRFGFGCRAVAKRQEDILRRIIARSRSTIFGAEHSFSAVRRIPDFRAHVPLATYQSFMPYIERILAGEPQVLTGDPVFLLEPSSGSAEASKLIPYTKSLKQEFLNGIRPWIYDLYRQHPQLLFGKAYWSISPAIEFDSPESRIPVGFRHDSDYLSGFEKRLIEKLLAVPGEVSRIKHIDAFRYVTVLFLLAEKDLSFISVWNPSFLSLLLGCIGTYAGDFILDIRWGQINPAIDIDQDTRAALYRYLKADKRRAGELADIFKEFPDSESPVAARAVLLKRIWPHMHVISCWADGHAGTALEELKTWFPHVHIQPKGLLATEGLVSFPLAGHPGSALAIHSHFFEFIEHDRSGSSGPPESPGIRLAHELREGRRYSVVITTGGGLYRYRLRDVIEVVGFFRQCPLIRFVGKEDRVIDLFGEKMNACFVDLQLKEIFRKYSLHPKFYTVIPERFPSRQAARYVLLIQLEPQEYRDLESVLEDLEERLQKNFHYRYCRQLGQLRPCRLFLIDPEERIQEKYLRFCQGQGQKLGDIKTAALVPFEDLVREFSGFYLK